MTMLTCTYSALRENLREKLDTVHETRVPILITRQNGPEAVLMDKEEYDGLMETLHLLRSPANAARLLRSIEAAERGSLTRHDIVE